MPCPAYVRWGCKYEKMERSIVHHWDAIKRGRGVVSHWFGVMDKYVVGGCWYRGVVGNLQQDKNGTHHQPAILGVGSRAS